MHIQIPKTLHNHLTALFKYQKHVFGYLIGHTTKTHVQVLNFLKCCSTLDTSKKPTLTRDEMLFMNTMIPKGLQIVGVYVSSDFCESQKVESQASEVLMQLEKQNLLEMNVGFVVLIGDEKNGLRFVLKGESSVTLDFKMDLVENVNDFVILRTSFELNVPVDRYQTELDAFSKTISENYCFKTSKGELLLKEDAENIICGDLARKPKSKKKTESGKKKKETLETVETVDITKTVGLLKLLVKLEPKSDNAPTITVVKSKMLL